MTRTVLRTTIRKKLGEATAVFWADSELNQWIEDAQLDIVWKTRCKRQRSLASTAASASTWVTSTVYAIGDRVINSANEYRCLTAHTSGTFATDLAAAKWVASESMKRYTLTGLVANCLRIIKVRIYDSSQDDWTMIEYITQDELDREYEGWETADPGMPMYYCYDTELNEFILYPKADTNQIGTNYLEIYNVPKPTAIATDSSSPDLPETLHPAVIDWVVATGLETRGYQDIAEAHWTKYSNKLSSYMTFRDVEEDEEIQMHSER